MKRIFTCLFALILSLTFYNAFSQTQQAQGFAVTAFNTNTVTVSWTNNTDAARTGYLLYANTTGTFTNPTGALPTADGDLSDGTAVVILGASATTQKFGNGGSGSDLPSNTHYYFKIFAYNSTGPAYLTGGGVPTADHFTLADVPTNASTMTFSSITATSMSVNATVGNGAYRLLIAREGAAVTFAPTDGTSYSALVDNNYTTATEVGTGGQGNKIVGLVSGATATFPVTGLVGDKNYFFTWVEVNGTDGSGAENYLGTSPLSGSRQTTPTAQVNTPTFSAFSTTGLTLSWTNGSANGDRRVVLIHEDADVDATPTELTAYTVSADWSAHGTQLGTGNYMVYDGTGTSVALTNLLSNHRYYFKIFEYNGAGLTTAAYLLTSPPSANRYTLAGNPGTAAITPTYSGITANDITINVGTAGNGAFRMVVVRQAGAVSFTPTDGTSYAAVNNDYNAGTEVGPGGQGNKIVYVGTATSFPVTGLNGDTNYNYAVIEFNGTAGTGAENYGGTLTGSRQTEPTAQANTPTFSGFTTTGMTLNWTNGSANGDRRVVLIHEDADVDADPVDFTNYTVSANWSSKGTQIGTGNYMVFDGTANTVALTNLLSNHRYYFRIYDYNGSNLANAAYFTTSPPGANHYTLATEPTTEATVMTFSAITNNSITVNFTDGTTGTSRILVGKSGTAAAFSPSDGTSYTAGTIGGTDVGAGYRVLGVGSGPFVISGLSGDQTYNFKVFEFNGTAGTGAENYKTGSPLSGDRSTEPTTDPSGLNFTGVGITGLTLNWSSGNGDRRVVLIHSGAAVDADPADLTNYATVSANWASGSTTATQIGTGNYIVYDGTGTSVAMTNLIANTVYHFAVYEYNGAGLTTAAYRTPGTTANRTTLATAPAPNNSSGIGFSGTTGSQTTLTWTNGDGANRVVVGHEAAAVNANPQNGNGYTANAVFGDPLTEIGTDNFVVYNGSGNTVTVTGLNSGTQYYFRIYDYNGSGASANYSVATPSNNPANTTTGVGANSTFSAGAGVEPGTFSSLITSQGAGVLNFDVTVLDDGATPGADNASTRISGLTINRKDLASGDVNDWSLVIAGAEFSGPAASGVTSVVASSITANQIVFTGIPFNNPSSNPELGRIGDDLSKTYVIKLWLKNPMDAVTAAAVDNKVIVMKITDADFTLGSGGSGILPGQSLESGDAKNAIAVVRSKIVVDQQPSPAPFAQQALAVQPIFEATDANGLRDRDFTEAIVVNTTNPDNLGASGAPSNFAAGLADFTLTSFSFPNIGTSTMKITTASITAANSQATNSITVSGSNESVVVEDTGFPYPSGFDYSSYQRSGSLNGSLIVAGILKVGSFTIIDGGLDGVDVDGVPTRMTSISFNVTNPGNLRLVGIDDGGTILTGTILQTQPGGATVTFSGLNPAVYSAPEGGSKTFGIWVSFNSPVIDNEHFEFQVNTVSAQNTGSVFANGDGGTGSGGAQTSTVTTDNQVTVFGDELQFVQQPINPTLIGVAMAPSPSVQVTDAFGSRDKDYTGTVTLTSTGTLSTAPTAVLSSGLGTFSAVTHSAKATSRTLTATLASLPPGNQTVVSSAFNLTASNQSDIQLVSNATFPEPQNIPYINYVNSSPTMTSAEGIAVAQFRIRDGGGSADGDVAPTILHDLTMTVTNSSYLKRIALFTTGGTNLGEVAAGPTVVFNGINGGGGFGVVDGSSVDFVVKVTFNQLAPVVDNSQFQFTITNAVNTAQSSDFIAANAGGAQSTIASNENRIEVTATKYSFIVTPPASIYAKVNFVSPVTVEARDVYNAKDADYTQTVNITNSGGITMTDAGHASVTPLPQAFVAGTLQLLPSFVYDYTTGVPNNGNLTFTDPTATIPALPSGNVTVLTSAGSDIVENTFSYPSDVNYDLYHATDINTTGGDEVKLAQFRIRDGGTSTDLDGTGTELKSINFSITSGSANLARVMLYDETNSHELGEVAVSGSTISFPTLAFPTLTGDNSDIVLALWATFKTTVTDNQKIAFKIASVTSNSQLSTFADPSAAGGAATNLTGTQNQIEVTVANLVFTSIPTSGTIGSPFTPVVITAQDANANTDLDFVSPVTAFSNDGGATMQNTPYLPDAIASFSAGVLSLSPTFAFTSTPAPGSHLSISAGGKTGISATSFTVTASQESQLVYSGSYIVSLDYINKQATTIGTATNPASERIAQFTLIDGNGSTQDVDNAPTTISQIQIEISTTPTLPTSGSTSLGAPAIKQIALFDQTGTTAYGEQTLSGSTATFSIGPLLQASDNGSTTFQIRASFNSTGIHDGDNIKIKVIKVVQGAGSEFNPTGGVTGGNWTKATGAVTGGASTPGNVNLVNVLATQLVFTAQPGSVAGINEPTTAPTIEARDANYIDLDQPNSVTITTQSGGAALNQTGLPFVNGAVDFTGFQYTDVGSISSAGTGNGKLFVDARNAAGTPITGSSARVDVYDIQATPVGGGVITTPNLAGGSVDKVIFGATFNSVYNQGGFPKLSGFVIRFSYLGSNVTDVLKNARIFETTSSTDPNGTDIASLGGSITPHDHDFTVAFSTPRDLSSSSLSYYLKVDIDPAGNGGTPTVTPSLVDQGPGGDISTTAGSATGSVTGNTYSFAAIFPPTLVSSKPFSGQTNVDLNPHSIDLTFSVPVWSLDEKIALHDGVTGAVVALLSLDVSTPPGTGEYPNTANPDIATLATPIKFTVPDNLLLKNHLYYVTIAPGDFGGNNAPTNAGIMDQSNNLFPGISYSGTLYFKTSNFNPVQMVDTKTPAPYAATLDPIVNNKTLNNAVLNATFDQKGVAYYIVLPSGSPAPTASQVRGATAYLPAPTAQGSFNINQTAPLGQSGIISPSTPFTPNANYDVWMAASNDASPTPITTSAPYGGAAHTAKTGTISVPKDSVQVVGIGTSFTTELTEGWAIFGTGSIAIGTIKSIEDDAHLTLITGVANAIATAPFFGPSYEIGKPGPTLTFQAPASAPGAFNVNKPTINICSNSSQILSAPIVLSESNAGRNEFAGLSPGVDQIFNLVLPSGFTFDVSLDGSNAPLYGKLTLSSGADFVAGSGKLSFIGNTVLKVTFRNYGNATADNMIISGLRVSTTGAASGNISRLGGNAFPGITAIGDGQAVALLNANPAPTVTFTNSYSRGVFGNNAVTTIPDQFLLTTAGKDSIYTKIELIPLSNSGLPLYAVGDFGPSTFSGTGVNINLLSLNTPTLGTPFNITITHTDNNGCVSQNPVQYVVYDHNTAIKIINLAGAASPSPYCFTNLNFAAAQDSLSTFASVYMDTTYQAQKLYVKYNNTSAYLLKQLSVTAAGGQDALSNPLPFAQDAGWLPLLQSIATTYADYPNLPNDPIPGHTTYHDYVLNFNKILNAKSFSGGPGKDPYEYFTQSIPSAIQNSTQSFFWYDGGLLGTVELSGLYQSIANQNVKITLRQNIQVYLPAVPLVLPNELSRSFLDLNDPLNMPGTQNGPRKSIGTPVYCQDGGLISISAYPQPASGKSTAFFTLKDKFGGGTISGVGFVDNGNGTATIDPKKIFNNFKDIEVIYTFVPTNPTGSATSLCPSTASQIIRVGENPVASYTTGNLCEGLPAVTFNGSTDLALTQIASWSWNFGDPNSGATENVDIAQNPIHKFSADGAFNNVNLVATSIYGCKSLPATKDLTIGSKPDVKFNIWGVSTDLKFINKTDIATPGTGPYAAIKYKYGDAQSDVTGIHTYVPGRYNVTLVVTSPAGCADSLTRPIVALPPFVADSVHTFLEDFELDSAQWQSYSPAGASASSWKYGHPTSPANSYIRHLFDSLDTQDPVGGDGNKMWVTGLGADAYKVNERSSLYSTVFNMSDLKRPMVSFNSYVDLRGSNGVVLQYSKDNKNIADSTKVWEKLGDVIGDGVDWFNEQGLSSKPGDQPVNPFGWSLRGGVGHDWLESKHTLDGIVSSSSSDLDSVVFRFALGANTPPDSTRGFGVDNFRLGNRTRTVLVENFKNLGNGILAETTEADYLASFNTSIVGTEMIKINYDVGFPATDPFNLDNPADPSARALYYNISSTPLARLDGTKNRQGVEAPFSTWGSITYDLRSLQLAQADIDLVNLVQADGTMSFNLKVKAVAELDSATTLHVAVLEQEIDKSDLNANQQELIKTDETEFQFVVKKMLPNAGGTRFNMILAAGDSTSYPFTYTMNPTRYYGTDAHNISLVVWVQNANTREVKQSRAFRNLNSPARTVTGLSLTAESINVYPNPASGEFKIELPEAAKQQVSVQMMDQVGKIVQETVIPQGAKSKTIYTHDIAEGIYILHLGAGNGTVLRTKVMVFHGK